MTTETMNERRAGDLSEVTTGTAGRTGEKLQQARSRLQAAVEAAEATCARLEDKTVAAAKATDRCIREHPYETIGAAFGLGLLIGVLVARK
jgi:ElaB/YqjD/DUF883 family membrane-anchored ribosome-binding protein